VTTSPMKKRALTIIPIIIIICSVGFIVFVLTTSGNVAKAQLIIDSGTVQVKHSGGSWISAQNGMDLFQSDSLKTGPNASVSVIIFESSIIRLDNNTEITLKELIHRKGETNVKIKQDAGRTWNTVSKISGIDNYEVQTSTTVASVRGTSFEVNIKEDGKTFVGIGKGTVNISRIKNSQVVETVQVNIDEAVSVEPDKIEFISYQKDDWVLKNQLKDEENMIKIKEELYLRIEPYIPELKDRYGMTDDELDVLIDHYILGDIDLPPDTPDWIRELIELS